MGLSAISEYKEYLQGVNGAWFIDKARSCLTNTPKTSLSESQLQQYADNLNAFMKGKSTSDFSTSSIQEIKAYIEEKYKGAIIALGEGHGAASAAKKMSNYVSRQSLIRYCSDKEIKNFSDKLSKAIAIVKNLTMDKRLKRKELYKLQAIKQELDTIGKNIGFKKLEENVAEYNRILHTLQIATPAVALAQGDFFENAIASIDEAIQTGATNIGIDMIEQKVIGNLPQGATFEAIEWKGQKLFSNKVTKKAQFGDSHAIVANHSQGTIDIQLNWSATQGKFLDGASAKSVSSIKNIKVASDRSMEAYITNESNEYKIAFLVAMRYKAFESWREDAFLSFKILSAYKGLTGDLLGREAATLFIVNDIGQQKVHIVPMQKIIDQLIQDMDNDKTAVNKYFSFSPAKMAAYILQGSSLQDLLNSASRKKLTIIFKDLNKIEQKVASS